MATMLGAAILRARIPPRLLQNLTGAFRDASWADFRHLAHALKPLLWSYVLGSTIGAVILAFIASRVALATIIAHRRHIARLQEPHNQ